MGVASWLGMPFVEIGNRTGRRKRSPVRKDEEVRVEHAGFAMAV